VTGEVLAAREDAGAREAARERDPESRDARRVGVERPIAYDAVEIGRASCRERVLRLV